MPGERCDIGFHWQKQLPGPRTSLQLLGTPGKTAGIMVLFGGTLAPP